MPLSAEMLTSYVGKICVFYEQQGAVIYGLPKGGAKKLVGQVIAAKHFTDSQPGNIPNALLLVRGRSGRTKEVVMVEQYAKLLDTWEEALEEQKLP